MIRRRFKIWQKVVAFAPLLLLAVALPSEALLRCQIDGILRSSCCCPPEKGTPNGHPLPALKAQDCCKRELTDKEPTAVEPGRRSATELLGAMIVALAPQLRALADEVAVILPLAVQSQDPPRDGPSIVLQKHAFLI